MSSIAGVLTREWGITNSTSATPVIGTSSIGPCVALFVYNVTFKQAALAHLDLFTLTAEAVDRFIQDSKIIYQTGALQVYLIGGFPDEQTKQNVVKISSFLTNKYQINVDQKYLYLKKETTHDVKMRLFQYMMEKKHEQHRELSKPHIIFWATLNSKTGELKVNVDDPKDFVSLNNGTPEESNQRHQKVFGSTPTGPCLLLKGADRMAPMKLELRL